MSINVQPCTVENFQNYLNLNYTNMYCLPPNLILAIQDSFLQKSNFGVQLSDSYDDPIISDNSFKIYSRDMFWSTSTQLPKDVYVYIRNNYVYSDFGWFFSDETTQRFPSYSFYETISTIILGLLSYSLFQIQKAKRRCLQRSYKRFNSILSEIGGFTQSFLAIGYLLCKKVSQTKLDIDLINKAFKFQGHLKNDNQKQKEEVNKSLHEKSENENNKKIIIVNSKDKKKNSKGLCFSSSDENLRKNYQLTKQKLQSFSQKSQIEESYKKQTPSENPQKSSRDFIYQNKKLDKFYCNLNEQDAILEQNKNQSSKSKGLQDKSDNQEQQTYNFQSKRFSENGQNKNLKQVEDQFKKHFDSQMNSMQLNVFNIINKLNELEKLKRIIFNQDQLKLFDYLPKPTIQADIALEQNDPLQNKEIDLLYQDNRCELQKACQSFQAYQNTAYKNDYSTLDQKLINQIETVLKVIFNQIYEMQKISQIKIIQGDENKIASCQNLTPSMRQSIYLSNQNFFQNNQYKAEKDKNSFRLQLNLQVSSKNRSTTFRLNQFEQQLNDIKDKLSKKSDHQNELFHNKTESQIYQDEFEEIEQDNEKKQLKTFRSNLNQLSQL
ncbi:hypothetical protein ABPG72_010860 [Tetrahymena utriculariae]